MKIKPAKIRRIEETIQANNENNLAKKLRNETKIDEEIAFVVISWKNKESQKSVATSRKENQGACISMHLPRFSQSQSISL